MIGYAILQVLALVVLVAWLARHFILSASRRSNIVIRPGDPARLPDAPPMVSIIVPAKDEEANIAACLETLLAQDYPSFEIIVVDDRSSDATAEIAREAAERDDRVRLAQVRELPAGWFGKPHAMHTGATRASGEWLWFVDADCRQIPHSLAVAMAHVLETGGDMLSLWPLLEMKGFAENLVQPLCGSILGLYFRPQLVNDPRKKAAFANGQFILVRRSAYEGVGGHESVRGRLVEDIAFARVVKGRGFRLVNAMGFDLFRTRMYDSLKSVWRGWTRIFAGAFTSPWSLVLVMLLILVMSVSPFVLAAVGGAMAWRAGWQDAELNLLFATGLAQLAAMGTVLVRYARMIRARPAMLILYPVSIVIVLGILLHALVAGLGLVGVRWRGTSYPGAKMEPARHGR